MTGQTVPDRYDKRFLVELVGRLNRVEAALHARNRDVVIGLPDSLAARSVAKPRLIVVSPNGTRYELRVTDDGYLVVDGPVTL